MNEREQAPGHSTDRRPLLALINAILFAPSYFILLTLFGLWPWRLGSPYLLTRPFRIPTEARNSFVLRLVAHRLLLRDEHLLRERVWITVSPNRLKRWIRSPWFVTYRHCARFTRAEMERTGLSGVATAIAIYCNSLVDSYRYANGTLHRDWFDLERRPNAAFHLPNEHHIRVCCYLLNHKLNPDMPVEQRHFDKAEFHRICDANNLPTIAVYAQFRNGEVEQHMSLPAEPLFSKPVDLAEGNGVFTRWTPVDSDSKDTLLFRSDDGSTFSQEGIFDVLKSQSTAGPYLLQQRLFNHEVIRTLSGVDALCSLRIPTCRHPDGTVEVLPFSFVRMPTDSSAAVDNMTLGSVAFPVDLESGQLMTGGKFRTFERFTAHPVTGEQAVGIELPYWQESVELCKKAHAGAFSTYATAGWDVAITPDGPRLVEMNIQWVRPVGLPDELFSGQTAYVDCILAHIRHFWPEQLPTDMRTGSIR